MRMFRRKRLQRPSWDIEPFDSSIYDADGEISEAYLDWCDRRLAAWNDQVYPMDAAVYRALLGICARLHPAEHPKLRVGPHTFDALQRAIPPWMRYTNTGLAQLGHDNLMMKGVAVYA